MSKTNIYSYEKVKEESYKQLDSIIPDRIEPFNIQKDDLLKWSYTLVLFPNNKLISRLSSEIDKLKAIDPNHFYMPNDKMHITLIGEIDSHANERGIIEACSSVIKKYKISFRIDGFASNLHSASILAYPNFDIHSFREEIRKRINFHGTNYGLHLTVYEYMGWINYMRYLTKPKMDLINAMKERSNLDFGVCDEGKLVLLRIKSRTLKNGYVNIVKDLTSLLQYKPLGYSK